MTISLDQQLASIAKALREPAKAAGLNLTDYLKDHLDRAVASRSGNQAKLDLLALEQGSWAQRFRDFCRLGIHPFGGPPPGYEPMQAADFHVVFGMIESARAAIKARMASLEVAR